MNGERPALQLHFDVNGTIILRDLSIGKVDIVPILKRNFAKLCTVVVDEGNQERFEWNGCLDWRRWRENIKPERGEMMLEHWCKEYGNFNHSKALSAFYEEFYNSALAKHFDRTVEELQQKFDALGSSSLCPSHKIIPSFFKLVNWLLEEERKFSIVVRTFGPSERVPSLVNEFNSFFQNKHSQARRRVDVSLKEEHVGVMHRDHDGCLLAFGVGKRPPKSFEWCLDFHRNVSSKNESKTRTLSFHLTEEEDLREGNIHFAKVPEGLKHVGFKQIYERFKRAAVDGETLIVLDDFPWWHANRKDFHCGKPLLVAKSDLSTHPILFDDNILHYKADPGIVDVIDVNSSTRLTFEEANEHFYCAANILLALDDEDYFIKQLSLCEENRRKQFNSI